MGKHTFLWPTWNIVPGLKTCVCDREAPNRLYLNQGEDLHLPDCKSGWFYKPELPAKSKRKVEKNVPWRDGCWGAGQPGLPALAGAGSHCQGPSPSQPPLPQTLIKGLATGLETTARVKDFPPPFVFKCRNWRSLWLPGLWTWKKQKRWRPSSAGTLWRRTWWFWRSR